ncbi:MAG: VOC family protein [Vulcanimicrobiota bacterium]
MLLGLRSAIYPVKDLAAAKAWYEQLLGFPPYFDEPFYVGFEVGGYELGLLPDGSRTDTLWGVENIQQAWEAMLEKGARPLDEPKDVGGGIWVASLLDPQGNALGIIENPHFKLAR